MTANLPFLLLLPLISIQEATSFMAPRGGRLEPRLRLSTIFIPVKGINRSSMAKHTKEEARALCEDLLAQLRKGADFADLAKKYSADPTGAVGGYLGQIRIGRVRPQFIKPLMEAKDKALVGPLESKIGFHIFQKLPIIHPWPERIAPFHILICHEGSPTPPDRAKSRNLEEARLLARKIFAEIKAGKLGFEKAAKLYSEDSATAKEGGSLGVRSPSDFVAVFSDAVVAVNPGEVTGPLETPFGFHILMKREVPPPYHVSHILIPWKGAGSAPSNLTRSKSEALALARELIGKLKSGAAFGELARKYSICPSAGKGGDLGTFYPGTMVPSFEKALKAAGVGSVVGPVETRFGYHLLLRHR